MKKFILIELKDEIILSFIIQLQRILSERPIKMRPHITIRGPYLTDINDNLLERINNKLHNPIKIQDVSLFKNDNIFVVYFKAYIDGLDKFWWKPTYPKKEFGLNPHITIYKGDNKELANALLDYFTKLNVSFTCLEYSAIVYTSKGPQFRLFDVTEGLPLNIDNFYKDILSDVENIFSLHSNNKNIHNNGINTDS